MDNTNLRSAIQTMFAGTSFESDMNNIFQNQEFMNCMMAFQEIVPTTMPTTREEKDACILGVNAAFDSSPAFQTPLGELLKPIVKSYLCDLIEAPSVETVMNYMNNACDQAGVGANDREDLRNGFLTAVADSEPQTEN